MPVVAALWLAGCAASTPELAYTCPTAGFIPDGDRLAVFRNMANPDPEAIMVRAELLNFRYVCKPVPRKGVMEVDMTLTFMADRLEGDMKALSLPYFVAVLDENENIVERQRHNIRLTFGKNEVKVKDGLPDTRAMAAAQHTVAVAVIAPTKADKHRVVFGFELTPAQVRFNRGEDIAPPPATPVAEKTKRKK
mgnify:CR=1 FL=1